MGIDIRHGGVTVAYKTPNPDMLEGRVDLSPRCGDGVVWCGYDLGNEQRMSWSEGRHPEHQCRHVSVCAARCVLRLVRYGVYPQLPDEIQLLWYMNLQGGAASERVET